MKKHATEALLDVTPPGTVVVATLFGMRLEDWVLYLTLAYTAVRLLLLLPKFVACFRCLVVHRTCTNQCKIRVGEFPDE